jgi:hypothetical protein
MLPRWHVLSGALFIALLWILIPHISLIHLVLVFFASFLIDFDHYAVAVFKTKKFGVKNALEHYKKIDARRKKEIARGIRKKDDITFFHTVEFHALIGLLSFLWIGFFYVFIGMFFHSLLDVFSMLFSGAFHTREFFLFNWARRRKFR